MRITTTTTVLDGTAAELAAYQQHLQSSGGALQTSPDVTTAAPGTPKRAEGKEGGAKFVKTDVAQRLISRRPLSKEQKIVLVELYKAHPDKLSADALQKATGYAARQLAGLMGAFGRRLANTPGYEEGTQMFDWVWAEDGCHYSLPDSVRTAMELEKLV